MLTRLTVLLLLGFYNFRDSNGNEITIHGSTGDILGILIGDPSKTTKGVVVLHEWWGVNDQIQEEAELIANKAGVVALVPDLYRGEKTTDNENAGHLMNNLDWPGAIKDIEAAIKHLKSLGCKKFGVTGFGMGGALTLAAAANLPDDVNAAAPFYGIPGDQLADVKKIKCPLQCHFGKNDALKGFSSPKDQDALQQKLKAGKVKFDFFSYDAGHAFTNTAGPNYDKDCCDLALKRMCEFMSKELS